MNVSTPTIDVRAVPFSERPAKIRNSLAVLPVGGSFFVVGECDPRALCPETTENPSLRFDVLNEGPPRWLVRIRRVAADSEGCCGICGG